VPTLLFSNTSAFLSNNQAKRAAFLDAVATGMYRAEARFIANIQQNQMSGQRGKLGTNVISDMLRKNWYQTTIKENQSIKAAVWSTTPYAPYLEADEHPDGIDIYPKNGKALRWKAGGRWFFAKKVHLPARLRIGEAWRNDFAPDFRAVIDKAAPLLR